MAAGERIAVVTGASRGIGRAIALRLAKDGYTVIVNYNHSEDKAQEVKAQIEENGGCAALYQCDVADAAACEAFISHVIETYARIDVLVNNAGINRDAMLVKMKEEDFDAVIDTNLKGTYHMMRYAFRQMTAQKKGRIINITSVVGEIGNVGQTNYAASKAGIIGMTKAAAREAAGRGVTVNAVAPGFIRTDMTDAVPDKIREKFLAQIPMKKFGEPGEVAAAVSFLASDDADYITGQVLNVDGGMAM